VYEVYFVGRLLEELVLADEALDSLERDIHMQACRYYRDLLICAYVSEDARDLRRGDDAPDP
jgi:hypothetical protein